MKIYVFSFYMNLLCKIITTFKYSKILIIFVTFVVNLGLSKKLKPVHENRFQNLKKGIVKK